MTKNLEWKNVTKRYDALGKNLAHRFDTVGADTAKERAALEKSLRGLVVVFDDLRTSAGAVVKDEKLRSDVTDLANALRDALQSTVERTAGKLPRAHTKGKDAKAVKSAKPAKAGSRPRAATARPASTRPARKATTSSRSKAKASARH